MFVAWLFALGMGLFDMAHLGNKSIFWRIALRPRSSWISRGFLLVILFIGSAAIQMALSLWAPGSAAELFFKVVAGIAALGVATYSGFVVSYVSCVHFWHSAVMPVLFILAGLAGGSSILLVVNAVTGSMPFSILQDLSRYVLLAYIGMVGLHLWISTYNSATSRNSAKTIYRGSLAPVFWPVVVLAGVVAPLAIISFSTTGSLPSLVVSAVLILTGNLALRYTILRAGMYMSLIP